MVDREGLTDAQVLAALYNASRPMGMGMLQAVPGDMTPEQAQAELYDRNGQTYFDYFHGRVIKVDVGQQPLDPYLYDRDLGPGACHRAIEKMFEEMSRP